MLGKTYNDTDNTIYNIKELPAYLMSLTTKENRFGRNTKYTHATYDIACAFDIETYSWIEDQEKKCLTYSWQFSINGYYFKAYSWVEFVEAISSIDIDNGIVIIWVHNLAYEFQFIRKWLSHLIVDGFYVEERNPMKVQLCNGIIFRDSYIYSGQNLANTCKGNKNKKHNRVKMEGDLDHTKPRNVKTPLTDEEEGYCRNDVMALTDYFQNIIESGEHLNDLALTNTGKVRRFMRGRCIGKSKNDSPEVKNSKVQYNELMKNCFIGSAYEYAELKEAFQGGFTHANRNHLGKTFTNVKSFDFASSYPAVMLSEKYPMSCSEPHMGAVDASDFLKYTKDKLSIFRIQFKNIKRKDDAPDSYISVSKCRGFIPSDGKTLAECKDNGRVVEAAFLETTITNIDFEIINAVYTYDEAHVFDLLVYKKAYLPKPFAEGVIELYKDKTELKGVEGAEDEYTHKKGMLNSTYGMCVTDIMKKLISYSPKDGTYYESADPEQVLIEKNDSNKNRFLYYPWGIFICAYARRNLWAFILECGDDHIYSDTDSDKIKNYEDHMEYVNEYNKLIASKLRRACEYWGIDESGVHPKDIKGKEHMLGIWDDEGVMEHFKTLGAKRYIYTTKTSDRASAPISDNLHLNITISGVKKACGAKYLVDTFKSVENIFDNFTPGLIIPESGTGKLTHTYIDTEISGTLVDYLGNEAEYHELSTIHMGGASYSLSASSDVEMILRAVMDMSGNFYS